MDNEDNVLMVVNGMMRSGTIWLTRMLADSLNVASRTLYHDPPYTEADGDYAVWHIERPGKFIRRLHYFPHEYPYSHVPMILIVRDIRDTIVSQNRFYGHRTWEGSLDFGMNRWVGFYSQWKNNDKVTTVVRYEDLVDNTVTEIERVLNDVGMPTDRQAIGAAVATHTFNGVATATNKQKGIHGRYGAWKTCMPVKIAHELWMKGYPVMEAYGYKESGRCQ